MDKFLIVDGTALVFRAFYAISRLYTSDGRQVNAIYGFFNILLSLILQEKPAYLSVCFDRKEETDRKKAFSAYKATRVKAPDDLYAQIDPIKEILSAGRFNLVEKPGTEADDLIATIANKNENNENLQIYIYSSDLDLIQLVNKIRILKPGNVVIDPTEVMKIFGFAPSLIPDYKGLHGDPSDNLPGVKGVGEKTAKMLIQKYGSIEQIYENIDSIEGALHKKLVDGKSQAEMCKKLATLDTNIDIPTRLSLFEIANIDIDVTRKMFNSYEFTKLTEKLLSLGSRLKQLSSKQKQQKLF